MSNTLTKEIEKRTRRNMHTHRDFVWLSNQVLAATAEYISATTLKRLWGHQNDYSHPSSFTLNLLSRYLGYADYKAFLSGEPCGLETSCIKSTCYMSKNLTEGDELKLRWSPNRHIVVRFEGDDRFEVVEALNSKLLAGDTFSCQSFIEGEPCCLNNLYRGEAGPYTCLVGKQGGVAVSPNLPPPVDDLDVTETVPSTAFVFVD